MKDRYEMSGGQRNFRSRAENAVRFLSSYVVFPESPEFLLLMAVCGGVEKGLKKEEALRELTWFA